MGSMVEHAFVAVWEGSEEGGESVVNVPSRLRAIYRGIVRMK